MAGAGRPSAPEHARVAIVNPINHAFLRVSVARVDLHDYRLETRTEIGDSAALRKNVRDIATSKSN